MTETKEREQLVLNFKFIHIYMDRVIYMCMHVKIIKYANKYLINLYSHASYI